MNATVPKPNKAIFPRMYTPSGKFVHRVFRNPPFSPLCARVPWWHDRVVEGIDLLDEFDPKIAAKLKICQTCHDRAGRFA